MAVTILPPLKNNSYHAFPSGDDKQREKGAFRGTAGQGYSDPQENITLGSSVAAVPVLVSAEDFTQRF